MQFLCTAVCVVALGFTFMLPGIPLHAQEPFQDLIEVVDAEVVKILKEEEREIIGTETTATVQEVEAHVTSGQKNGATVTFENDVTEVRVGDRIKLQHLTSIDGGEYYLLKDFNRLRTLAYLGITFVAVLWFVAGKKGVRALLSLCVSIGIIVYALLPLLLAGYDPVLISVGVAGLILSVAIFATHGFGAHARIAFLGTMIAVLATGALSVVWVSLARLTGFASDAAIYLNFSTHGALDFSGLLLGGILIGVLGVLDDVAITQASVTIELVRANATLSGVELYRRALRVGQDHIGSLVNTLALAYTGVSLPLLMLFARTDSGFFDIVNQEVVASEIVRTLVGSLGLMLTVPATTFIAVWYVRRYGVPHDDDGHAHHHGHTH
jgi:uncharacterized membrane protein